MVTLTSNHAILFLFVASAIIFFLYIFEERWDFPNFGNYAAIKSQNFTSKVKWEKNTNNSQEVLCAQPIILNNSIPVWTVVKRRRLVLRSAYVDLGHLTYVQIMANMHCQEKGQVRCRFFSTFFQNYSTVKATYELLHTPFDGSDICTRNGYEAFFIYCPLPPLPGRLALYRPTEISIFAPESESIDQPKLKIDYVPESQWQLAVCVAPLFDWKDENRLVFFLEYYIYQGVDYFLIYNYSSSVSVSTILKEYKKLNYVEIIQWPEMPKTMDDKENPNHNIHYRGQVLAINDCIFRMKSKAKYVAILDLDDILIPLQSRNDTIIKLIQEVDQPLIGEFMFLHSYTYINWPYMDFKWNLIELNEIFNFSTLITLRESYIWPATSRSKVIIKPIAVKKQAIHLLWKYKEPYKRHLFTSNETMVYHLRPLKSKREKTSVIIDEAFRNILLDAFNFTNFNLTVT